MHHKGLHTHTLCEPIYIYLYIFIYNSISNTLYLETYKKLLIHTALISEFQDIALNEI